MNKVKKHITNIEQKMPVVFSVRSVIAFVLIATIIGGAAGYTLLRYEKQSADTHITNFSKQYPYVSPFRELLTDENLVVNVQPLRTYLKKLPQQHSQWAEMSIYFEALTTGANITVNQDLQIWPASLSKLPTGMVIMKKVEQGDLSLDQKLVLEPGDLDGIVEDHFANPAEQSYTVEFLLKEMLQYSSNVGYRVLKRQLNETELQGIVDQVGLEELFSEDGKVSAKDYARLFRALYLSSYLSPTHSQKMLQLLADSNHATLLKSGLPDTVPFAHKWGTNIALNVFSDAGIVYVQDRPYLLSVMVAARDTIDSSEAEERVNELMREISTNSYQYVAQGEILN